MAFFDKLENLAKNIGDKTSDAIETGKLHSKINAEKNLAAEQWEKIGEFYYNLYISSGEAVPEILEYCEAARAHLAAAEEAQAAIEKIRAENEAESQAAAQAKAAVPVTPEPTPAAGTVCPGCGAAVPDGKKFCGECGMKIEIAVPSGPKYCTACGAEIAEGRKFCSECGTKAE